MASGQRDLVPLIVSPLTKFELSIPLKEGILRHVACGKGTAWAVDSRGVPYFRFGVQPTEPGSGMSLAWIPVEHIPQPLLMIAISPDDRLVWACDEKFNVYARVGITSEEPYGQKWELIPNQLAKELCTDNKKVYALSENGELICRYGISESNIQGNYWKKMPGKYEHITVGEGGELWTMDDKGQVWKQEWTVLSFASHQPKVERLTSASSSDWVKV